MVHISTILFVPLKFEYTHQALLHIWMLIHSK
jgi:hypothetical protein